MTPCLYPRDVLSAARGGGHHRGRGGRWRMLLLWAGPLASHAVMQRCFQPALAGLGSDGHQVPAGGLQHQWEQCCHHAASVRSSKAAHHLLPEGTFTLQPEASRFTEYVCLQGIKTFQTILLKKCLLACIHTHTNLNDILFLIRRV